MATGLSSTQTPALQDTLCLLLLLSGLCCSFSDPSVFMIYSDVAQSCLESSGNAVGLSPVCNQSSEQQQWKWVSRLRLFNLGSRQCLAMLRQNGSGASAALGTIECDLESAQTRWHCGKLGEQLGGFLNRSPGGAPTSGSWDPATAGNDVWRIYKTNQDLCARPYHEIYTIQGNSNGKPCTIPFKYDNQWYHGCTTIGREDGHLWCATTVDYGRDERWGFCPIMTDDCETFWDKDPLTNSCYQFNFQSTLSWNEARTSCQQQNSDLLSITELHEQTYINGLLTGYSATLWIGLNDLDIDGGWQWSDGSPLKYLNWEEDQPVNSLEENCGVIRTESSGRWQNKDCGIARPYVCKKKPNGTAFPDTYTWKNFKTTCESGWLPFHCNCYRLNSEKRTWQEARKSCVRSEGDLLSVHHLAELEFVLTSVKQDVEELWIGLNDIKLQMNFAWSDGSPVNFTYWHPYEPNNFHSSQEDCVTLWGEGGRWNDGPCNLTLPSICKKASCLGEEEVEDDLGCQKGWRYHSSSCYLVAEEMLTFKEALKKCTDQSSALVTITNRFEQSFVISLILGRSGDSLWTGLGDVNHPGVFQWLGGDPVSFTNWNRDQPGFNGGCVVLATGNSVGLWEVKDCNSFKAKYICRQNLATPVTPDPGPPLPTPSLTGSCPQGWLSSPQLRYCYKVFHSSVIQGKHSWPLAHASCVELGAQLLSIGSSEEEQFAGKMVHEIFGESEEHEQHWFWIGLNRRNPGAERSWKWSDGLGYSYHNFRRDAYDDDDVRRCAVLDMVSKQWMAVRCETRLDWICKIRKGVAVREPEDTQEAASKQWLRFDEAEYKFFEHHSTWPQAQRICTWFGAELASVHSQRELSFLGKTLRKLSRSQDQPWWIGLQTVQNDGRFRWSDSSILNFVSWAFGKPRPITKDRKCVYMLAGKEEWGDQKCLTDLQYVCKRTNVSSVVPPLPPPPSVSGGCPGGWTPFLNKCFQLQGQREAERVSWIEGKAACERAGGVLATISNRLEQAFITTLLPNITFDLWIGLHDTNKDFQWLEKEPVKFVNWAPGEPSGHRSFSVTNELVNCAVVWHGTHPQFTGRWDDRSCRDQKNGYICQRNKDPSLPPSPARFPPPLTPTLSYMNNTYRMIQKQLSWQEAMWLCESHNLSLASINDAYNQAFLTQVLNAIQQPLWIGLSNIEGGSRFSWMGDRPVPYTHWQAGEPQQSTGCVYMEVDGTWRTSNCDVKRQGAICKVNGEAVSVKSQFNGTCPTRLHDSNWIAFRNHCYTFNLEKKAASKDAGKICRKEHGAEVLSILDETENVFIWEHLQTYEKEARGAWLGLSYNPKGDSLVWSDKIAVNYSNWVHQLDIMRLTSPKTCYWINSNTGGWVLGSCTNVTLGIVCKRPRVLESDSPVSTELQSHTLDIILYVLGAALLLAVLLVLLFLYRRRGGHGARGGAFESARYSRTTSAPSESLEKNILVSDMEMNEQQE